MDFERDWIEEVRNERNRILESNKSPLEILVGVFELCENEFDITMLKKRQPQLYQILQEFCSHVPATDEELRDNSRNLAKFFNLHKDEIRDCDIQLYYALLNFIDMLKKKKMYLIILQT